MHSVSHRWQGFPKQLEKTPSSKGSFHPASATAALVGLAMEVSRTFMNVTSVTVRAMIQGL